MDHLSEKLTRNEVDQTKAIHTLIKALGSTNETERFTARETLIHIGKQAIPALEEVLHDSHHVVRWNAVKALADIGDAAAAAALVEVLEDDVFDIRWIASDGLIGLGLEGLKPVLQALEDNPGIASLRESAHHICNSLSGMGMKRLLTPVIDALNSVEPAVSVPTAAEAALLKIHKLGG
jgi:HEAT repeat protein